MDDLVKWLGEQLDEEERVARATDDTLAQRNLRWFAAPVDDAFSKVQTATGNVVGTGEFTPEDAAHIAAHDPGRVLREIGAKRQAVAHFERVRKYARDGVLDYALAGGAVAMQLKIMALPYADRPGYREEWRP